MPRRRAYADLLASPGLGTKISVLLASAAVFAMVVFLVAFFVFRLTRARNAALAEAMLTQRIEGFMLNLFDGGTWRTASGTFVQT